MKARPWVLLLALAAILALSMPGIRASKSGLQGEITVIAPIDTPGFYPKVAKQFEKLHPGTKVNFVEASWENIIQKYVTDMSSGIYTYDVIFNLTDRTAQFVNAGWIREISPALQKDNACDYLGKYKGKYWGVCYNAYPEFLAYNEEMLNKAGYKQPPKTWDEFFEVCKKIKAAGICKYPYDITFKEGIYGPRSLEECAIKFGGRLADDNGAPLIGSPESRAGVAYIVKMFQEGLVDPAMLVMDDFECDSGFAQGRYFCHDASGWGFTQATKNPDFSTVIGKVHAMRTPKYKGKGASWMCGLIMEVPKTAKNVPLALEYIKYMSSFETQKQQMLETGNIACHKRVLRDAEVRDKTDSLDVLEYEIVNGVKPPYVTWYNDWYNWVSPLLAPLLKGELSVHDFIARNLEQIKKFNAKSQ